MQDVPIQLVGTTFLYTETDSSSVMDEEAHPSPSLDHDEVTHVDETTLHHPTVSVDDQESQKTSTSAPKEPASECMVVDPVATKRADKDHSIPSEPRFGLSSANEPGNETSYGLLVSATAMELGELQDQPPLAQQPLTTKRMSPSHSQQHSPTRTTCESPTDAYKVESSISSSMPEPTNRTLPRDGRCLNQPLLNATFPTETSFTTGRRPSTTLPNDSYSAVFDCNFRSSALDFGGSGSVKGLTNVQTPPNGQGAD